MKTILINSEGEEVATTERIKYNVSTHVSRGRESFNQLDGSNGHNSTVGVSVTTVKCIM